MLSWMLWRAIYHPPHHHPLVHYVRALRPPARKRSLKMPLALLLLCPIGYGMALFWPSVYPVLFAAGSPPTIHILVMTGLTMYLMTLAARVGLQSATLHERGLYDLLAVSPVGGLSAVWVTATAHLHTHPSFRWFRFGLNLVAFTLILALAAEILLPLVVMVRSGRADFYPVLIDVSYGLVLAIIFYLDMVQSLVLAYLTGLLLPFYLAPNGIASLGAAALFFSAQAGIYFIALLAGSLIYRGLQSSVPAGQLEALVGAVIVLLIIREGINRRLWAALRHHTAADTEAMRRWRAGKTPARRVS